MFKIVVFLDVDNETLNPFECQTIQSLIRGGVLAITPRMVEQMHKVGCGCEGIVVIGDRDSSLEMGLNILHDTKYVKDISECIKHLSRHHSNKIWWIVCENAMTNDLISKGVVMDVHLSKNYAKRHSSEWIRSRSYTIPQEVMFDRTLLNGSGLNGEFELVSNAGDTFGSYMTRIRHYCRRNCEESYLLLAINDIISNGFLQTNRTGVRTRAAFGKQFQYVMTERVDPKTGVSSFRLPLLTTKKMFVRGIFAELKWFLSGSTDSKELEAQGVNIWKGNSSREYLDSIGLHDYAEGECGPIYGYQWRNWGGQGIDQVQNCIESLKSDPFSRRHIISGWNVADLDKMCLPPCHVLYHFMCHEKKGQKYLTLSLLQRSCDAFHGLPFNICSASLFLIMVAHQVGMKPHKLIHNIDDMHIYETHIEPAKQQLYREPCMFPYVRLNSAVKPDIKDYNYNDIIIEDYYSYNSIKADMVV